MLAGLRGSRIFGDASWALLGQVGSGLMLLLGTRILTELVTPDVYGEVALMVGIVALGVNNFSSPFLSAGMRLLPECTQAERRQALMSVLRGLTVRAAAVAVVVLGVVGTVYALRGNAHPWPFAAAAVLLAVTVRREFGVQMLIAERRQREATLWQTTDSILRPILAISAVIWWESAAAAVLLGYALASGMANILWARRSGAGDNANRNPGTTQTRSLRREVLAYAWPLIPMELVGWFNTLGDRYVIAYLMTAANVGIYAAAYTLVNEAFNRSAMVLLRTFQPLYFHRFSADKPEPARRVFAIWICSVVAVGLIGVLALIWLKDWVAKLLLAEAFQSAAVLMPVIGAGCALQAIGGVLAQPLYARKRTRPVLLARIFGVISAVISIPLMVKWQGVMGAAIAAPIYFGIEAFALLLVARPWSDYLQRSNSLKPEICHEQ